MVLWPEAKLHHRKKHLAKKSASLIIRDWIEGRIQLFSVSLPANRSDGNLFKYEIIDGLNL